MAEYPEESVLRDGTGRPATWNCFTFKEAKCGRLVGVACIAERDQYAGIEKGHHGSSG
jgi:hypothetical protein